MEETQNLIERLNLSGKRLSKSHRRIAEYIMAHYDKAVFMTAATLGEMVGVSESTVVRFAMALGYEGYPQLQHSLQELVRHRLTAVQRFEMTSEIPEDQVLSTVLKADMLNIRHTVEQIDDTAFKDVVERLLHADSIYVLGLRSAAPLAQFFGYYLHFIFDDVRVVASGTSDVFETISRIRPTDVLIGISFPRYSTRTLEAMRFAHESGAQVIGLTDGPMSPLHKEADICLSARTDMASFVDSLVAPLSVINALLVALAMKKREDLSRHFEKLEGIWDAYSVYINKENQ
ncbi:MAG: MurR/RpiR family transcriptional regulator [Clostridia bacterium]|nr:MurR/RpiR family transcriptional regulator [Clostridia bacterium]MDD6683290.1 MurR/RpiR family transcriptional regulator [Clostridiales bacterium]